MYLYVIISCVYITLICSTYLSSNSIFRYFSWHTSSPYEDIEAPVENILEEDSEENSEEETFEKSLNKNEENKGYGFLSNLYYSIVGYPIEETEIISLNLDYEIDEENDNESCLEQDSDEIPSQSESEIPIEENKERKTSSMFGSVYRLFFSGGTNSEVFEDAENEMKFMNFKDDVESEFEVLNMKED